MLKKFTALLIAIIILPAFEASAFNYDTAGAFDECCTLYPEFIENINAQGATDKNILTFMESVKTNLLVHGDELTEENFQDFLYDAVKSAFSLRNNIRFRNALAAAYPDSVAEGRKGFISDELMPVYITVKRYIFGLHTPAVTLSCKNGKTRVNQIRMPAGSMIVAAFYNSEGTLIRAFINPEGEMDINADYARVYAFRDFSLEPLCESYTYKYTKDA